MSRMRMVYVGRQEAECHDCGEKKDCSFYTALSAEPETGYLDELSICDECAEKKGIES